MSVLNKNDFFYTALRVAVAQHKNPDWIFKTNLLHIDNISQKIYSDNLIRPSINLDAIYEYLEQETPFHVHFENYAIQYTKNDEICNADVNDEHLLYIDLGYNNVSEYPTTFGYDKLPYDFEYPGLGTNGQDYTLIYNPDDPELFNKYYYDENYGFKIDKVDKAGWYAFTGKSTSLEEDPKCASYDYNPTINEFTRYVLKAYNAHHNTDLSVEDLLNIYYKDRYFYDNSANYLYLLNQNKTFEWVKEQLYNNFKGLELHGGKNGGDKNGYETTPFDNQIYDYLTYENKYYVTDGEPADWFLVESTKFNENKVVPTSTTKFYTPIAPFATKKLNVYLSENERFDNFNVFGNAYKEEDWLKNISNIYSYLSLKTIFAVYNRPWEISLTLKINEYETVIYNQETRFNSKLISILGSSSNYYLYSVPQLYVIKDTVFLDVSTNGEEYDVRLFKKGLKCDNTYQITIGYDKTQYYLNVEGNLDEEPETATNDKSIVIKVKANYNKIQLYKGEEAPENLINTGYINKNVEIVNNKYVPIYSDSSLINILLYIKTIDGILAEPVESDIKTAECLYYVNEDKLKKEITENVAFIEKTYQQVNLYYPNTNLTNPDYSQYITGYIDQNEIISDVNETIIYSDKELTKELAYVTSYTEGGLYFTDLDKQVDKSTVEGLGEFHKSDEVVSYNLLDYMKNEYTSSVVSYIDTRLLLDQKSRVKMTFSIPEDTEFTHAVPLFGCGGFYATVVDEHTLQLEFNDVWQNVSVETSLYGKHTIDFNKNEIFLDDELVYTFTYYDNFESRVACLLFALQTEVMTAYGEFDLWSCEIYKDDILVLDLKPAVREHDGELGFVDVKDLSGSIEFYTNVANGKFIAGERTTTIIRDNTTYPIYKCIIDRDRMGYAVYNTLAKREVLYVDEEIYTPKSELVETNSKLPIYYEKQSVLRIGDSTYRKDLLSYVPYHFIGGIFIYEKGLPYYSEETNDIFVPSLNIMCPISKNNLVKLVVDTIEELPPKVNDGVIAVVSSTDTKYIFYDNTWTIYKDSEYIQQLGLSDTTGTVYVLSFYTINDLKQSAAYRLLLKNQTSDSNVAIPETVTEERSGLLLFRLNKVFIETSDYLGKFAEHPVEVSNYPAYYFNVQTDSYYYKGSEYENWAEQYDFVILGKVIVNEAGKYNLKLFPTFDQSPDIRYLYQDADINIETLKFTSSGLDVLTTANKFNTLKINRDYTVGIDQDGKEYIEILNSKGEVKTLSKDSVLQIDCLDYDYLYDVIYGNKDNAEHNFTRYREFLGTFSSLEDLINNYGHLKVKFHDYFYNTSTNTEWLFEYKEGQLDIEQRLYDLNLEVELTTDNYDTEIFEIMGFEFGWIDTKQPFGTIQAQDLIALKGTKLLRPNNTAKGSEELRTTITDGVIIDVIEDASYLDINEIKIAPNVLTETLKQGKNKEISTKVMNNDSAMLFYDGLYYDSILKWKARIGLNKLPDYQMNPLLDVASTNNKLVEIEQDTLEIVFSQLLYEQNSLEFTVEVDKFINTDFVVFVLDGKILSNNEDYLVNVIDNSLRFTIINPDLIDPDETYCYGIYVLKSERYSVVHKDDIDRTVSYKIPIEVPVKMKSVNVSAFNNILAFDSQGKRVKAPYMKWYYLEEDTRSIVLPVNDAEDPSITSIDVYIGSGHQLSRLLKVSDSQYTINGNVLTFNSRAIPKNLTIGVIITTSDSYNLRFLYDNGRYIVDYQLNYIIDYFENYIVDYGTDEGDGEGVVNLIQPTDLDISKVVYIDYPERFNFRLDEYQRTANDEYTIVSDRFDKKSVCVWKNGVLLNDSEFTFIDKVVHLYTTNNLDTDIIQIWYKINVSIKSKEHNKLIISDTNRIFNLMNLPEVNTFLVYPFAYNSLKMYVDNANFLTQPNLDPRDYSQSHPGRIQIGNEILEFWSIDYYDKIPGTNKDCHSLSGFVRGINGSAFHDLEEPYPVGTGIQDIGLRFDTLVSNTKNRNSQISYTTVIENWEDYPERDVHSLMPWYNIPGDVYDEKEITVWKTEPFTIMTDYDPEVDTILNISDDQNIQNIQDYRFKSPIGYYTYDVNRLVEYSGLYYRSNFINDTINIELYNVEETLQYSNIQISGNMNTVASQINNAVDNSILTCIPVYDELEEMSYMIFNLKRGYSMIITENDDASSFFIQELFGGIQKSTNFYDITEEQQTRVVNSVRNITLDLIDTSATTDEKRVYNGISIKNANGSKVSIDFREPEQGIPSIDLFINEANNHFDTTKVWFSIKANPEINNVEQLNIVNYNKEEVILEEYGSGDNFRKLGIYEKLDGCTIIDETNENGRFEIKNDHVGRIIINEKVYTFDSIKYLDNYVALIGITLNEALSKDTVIMGSNLIKQELNDDYYIEFEAVKFYERLPIGTLIRIQNKDIVINSNTNYLHSHELDS